MITNKVLFKTTIIIAKKREERYIYGRGNIEEEKKQERRFLFK